VASLGSRGDTRSTTDDHGVIELSDIRNAETLADEPLQIEIRQKLNANEALLPFAFDGEHVLPCGQVTRRDDGDTQVTLDHLPETPSDRRSVGGSLKLYFFKTYLKNNDVNRLRWIKFKKDGSWEYHKDEKNDEDTVRGQVAAAERVLLLVHGWIGDTEGMAAGVSALGLRHHFDLVLAYDYENLSTPIADTARTLKRDLADVGLRDGDGKHLTLLVHSMGGLVSRWFIEHEGGNAVVDHLVMCGTPNFGSPFGHVDEARKLLVVLLGLAANYMPGQVHWIALVQLLLNRSQKVTPTLEQMNPGHDFITKLNDSEDPGIPYTIVAGNVREYREPTDALFAKLLAKVGQSVLFDALFAQKANDIAVAVDSIRRVTPRRVSPPEVVNVNCHHLNYFVSEVGQQALRRVAW
jgi:pimeloyl-ACP methyl ester carboxylesterase